MAVQYESLSQATPCLAQAGALAGAALALLDRLERGVIILDSDARVLHVNVLARGQIARGDAVTIIAGRLVLHSICKQRLLLEFLRRPATVQAVKRQLSLTFPIITSPPHRSYGVQIAHLAHPDTLHVGAASHYATIYEPHSSHALSDAILIDLYGLTRREAALTARLYAGGGLDETAQALGMSLHTARTHLKRVFNKCEVRTQAELLQLLALGPRHL